MSISLIVAVAENRVIGYNNKLPWYLPADLKYFKSLTMGHHIIMGRKTFESIGGGKPLPGRTTVIVTRQMGYHAEGCMVAHSLEQALNIAKADAEPFIIGGAELFKQALEIARKLYLTKIHHNFDGDTFFPSLNLKEWKLLSCEEHEADEKNKYPYAFLMYEKNG